jgi:hypothetical protein
MSKPAILGFGCLVLVGVVIYAAIRFPIGCLFVPCDRVVQFVLQPPEQDLDGCELLLFDPDDKALSDPWRRLEIEDHKAEVIVQPHLDERLLVALGCKGSGLSAPELIDYKNKESITLHLQKPGA